MTLAGVVDARLLFRAIPLGFTIRASPAEQRGKPRLDQPLLLQLLLWPTAHECVRVPTRRITNRRKL